MSKRILLTGGSGLIGSDTVKCLTDAGHDLITLGAGKQNSIAGFDLTSRSMLKELEGTYDIVVHLAAQIPGKGDGEVHLTNRKIDENVFQFAISRDIPLIYASSASVYGSAYQEAVMDEGLRCVPQIEYSKQKLDAEAWIQENLREYYICRITAPYGPSKRYQGVLNIFCRNVIAGRDITLYGKGSRCQDFVNIRDVSAFFSRIAESSEPKQGIYNVSGGSPLSMKEVAEIVLRVAGSRNRVIFADAADPQENFKALYSIEKAVDAFGWLPGVSLEQGITELLDFLRSNDEDSLNI